MFLRDKTFHKTIFLKTRDIKKLCDLFLAYEICVANEKLMGVIYMKFLDIFEV